MTDPSHHEINTMHALLHLYTPTVMVFSAFSRTFFFRLLEFQESKSKSLLEFQKPKKGILRKKHVWQSARVQLDSIHLNTLTKGCIMKKVTSMTKLGRIQKRDLGKGSWTGLLPFVHRNLFQSSCTYHIRIKHVKTHLAHGTTTSIDLFVRKQDNIQKNKKRTLDKKKGKT